MKTYTNTGVYKMTSDEIKKALKCCSNPSINYCKDCPYANYGKFDCCNGKRNLAYGYQWNYIKFDKMKKIIPKVRKISQYTLNKKFIKTWNSATEIKNILESKDRTKAGISAPASGLYLNKVWY